MLVSCQATVKRTFKALSIFKFSNRLVICYPVEPPFYDLLSCRHDHLAILFTFILLEKNSVSHEHINFCTNIVDCRISESAGVSNHL